MNEQTVTGPPAASLPDAILPVLVRAGQWMIEHSPPDGRLMVRPGEHTFRNWYDLSALAVVYTTESPSNPLFGDRRVGELIGRAGGRLVEEFSDPAQVNMDGLWYDDRPHEWVVEAWLLTYELLNRAGATSMTSRWAGPLRRCAAAYDRYCRQVEHVRRMTSPNLKISTNHFAWFAAMLIRLGQVFADDGHVRRGLAVARKIAEHQHPDGYWRETHGPTTSYNLITAAAVALCDRFTDEPIFAQTLRRALDFHLRFTYPDGVDVETIDQRVRYPHSAVMALHAFSRWPEGRGWAQLRFARAMSERMATPDGQGEFGRLANAFVHYLPGPVAPPLCTADAYQAGLSDQPAGLVKRSGWVACLCGIPSRPRNHRYTLDRQNLLSVWQRDCGLMVGGGNNRDDHVSATFFCRINRDPNAVMHDAACEDAYVPVAAALTLDDSGGELDLEYWGFDATLAARIVDERTCVLTASAGTLPQNAPVLLNLQLPVRAGEPVRTAAGAEAPVDESEWELSGVRLGAWVGQGGWRIDLPDGASVRYPLVPYRPNPAAQPIQRLALLTVPLANRAVELTVRRVGQGGGGDA